MRMHGMVRAPCEGAVFSHELTRPSPYLEAKQGPSSRLTITQRFIVPS